jgi:hypothetical protein
VHYEGFTQEFEACPTRPLEATFDPPRRDDRPTWVHTGDFEDPGPNGFMMNEELFYGSLFFFLFLYLVWKAHATSIR